MDHQRECRDTSVSKSGGLTAASCVGWFKYCRGEYGATRVLWKELGSCAGH